MDATVPGPPSSIPDVSEPTHPTPRPEGPPDRRIRRAWWIFATSFFCLCLIAVLRLALDTRRPIDVVLVGLIVLVGFAAIRHREAVAALEVGRRERGGVVRPDPVEPVAVGVARRDRGRHRGRAGRCDRRGPHRHRPPPARRPRPRGDPGQRPPGRARLDDAPADRRPRGPGARTSPTGAGPRAGGHPRRGRGPPARSPRGAAQDADRRPHLEDRGSRRRRPARCRRPAGETARAARRRSPTGSPGGRARSTA